MVKVSALALFVNEQLKKYDLAKQYFEASSKWAFWKLQPKKFNTTNRIVGDSMIEYLTLQQRIICLQYKISDIQRCVSCSRRSTRKANIVLYKGRRDMVLCDGANVPI